MTRKSQDFFKHRIEPGSLNNGVRYSLTFRALDWRNKNSTVILGDSNTCGLKFGTSRGTTFGSNMPGKQEFQPHVKDINPLDAISYQNVVVMCGINDIRQPSVKCQADINNIFYKLKDKIKSIQHVNPAANVFICPALPTKLHDLNKRVLYFNSLIRSKLVPANLGVTYVDGFDEFLHRASGLLEWDLSRPVDRHGRPDHLHLNRPGAALLAGKIKHCIIIRSNGGIGYGKRQMRRSSRVDGRLYSGVAESGQTWGLPPMSGGGGYWG